MDFEFSKENILPLPGGRNVHQLGMALQAQTNRESQLELLQQKEQWEELIRTYTGDDPLENYYKYISWIEQTYPKHGHEGNLIPLLEHCLNLFESDKRYSNDRRFCKLWIKYFDLQTNPLELYHMVKAKGICKGCADFYKAWAYYHEAAGDFQSANKVFEEGKRNLAQPYDELESAHQNLIMAAGQHMLYGPNECQLLEKRQALTSLHTHRSGRVSSVRVPSNNGLVTVPSNSSGTSRPNAMIQVYQERPGEAAAVITEAAPISIVAAAKRQEVPKENTLKAGPWTGTIPVKKRVIGCSGTSVAAGFTVHEDAFESPRGIRLPKNHPKTTLEDYSDWEVAISYPDPPNPACIPKYPKDQVYCDPHTEYSIEEVMARRYINRTTSHEILDDDEVEIVETAHDVDNIPHRSANQNETLQRTMQGQYFSPQQPQQQMYNQSANASNSPRLSFQKEKQRMSMAKLSPMQRQSPMAKPPPNPSPMQHQQSPILLQQLSPMQHQPSSDQPSKDNSFSAWPAASTNFDLWQSPQTVAPFGIFEQSLEENQPKGSAMKTAFKVLNADELAETGSRGGMDVAVTAQATDSAKPMPFGDSLAEVGFERERLCDDSVLNTQVFNLNAMQVSTPQGKMSVFTPVSHEEELASVKKHLFCEPQPHRDSKALSTILEETKNSYASSSSGSCHATTKSFNKTNQLDAISEEHNNNLAQNMMANAALRSSLLADLMDFGQPDVTVPVVNETAMQISTCDVSMRSIPEPASVTPLEFVPSDPFKSQLISQLLERVAFPGPHVFGYVEISFIPRLYVRKEPITIGRERYIIDKQLGKGTFGTVYKAQDLVNNVVVAMKYQKPANKWEFYICRELQSRLAKHPLRDRFMDISLAYFGDQASLIISNYMPGGSLLDLANLHKQKVGKTMKECLVVYFCIQMLEIVRAMHQVQIIHADIKPDNFLVFVTPDNAVGLQLIDFGCSIDMSLLPPNATFRRRVMTEDFVCCEMLDGRPWNYHTDLFCIAATAHVLLFDSYIRLQRKDDLWSIQQRFPRYLKVDSWNMFFSTLLNQQTGPADAASIGMLFQETLEVLNKDSGSALPSQMRYVVNLLKNR